MRSCSSVASQASGSGSTSGSYERTAASSLSSGPSAKKPSSDGAISCSSASGLPRQHFLNFLPLPQGQGSLRPTPRNGLRMDSPHGHALAGIQLIEYLHSYLGP